MEFHFVKLNVNGTYLSLVDPTEKSRFICFSDRDKAKECVKYVSSFRSKHGVWPCFDMSRGRRKLESKLNVKSKTPDQIERYLEIETYNMNTIDRIASRTNSSFYCILHFETEDMGNLESISMSGQEMDAIVDEAAYRDLLEYNLKIN
tara:strand:+ start:1226 stop:1669 length:444 start_codon:yes stop_codon:yes gene_type:complete